MDRQNENGSYIIAPDAEKQLYTNASCGLSRKEARSRYRRFGPNTVFDPTKAEKNKALRAVLTDPAILLLLFSTALSMLFFAPERAGAALLPIVCGAAILLRILLAERAVMASIQKIKLPEATVFRNGKKMQLSASKVVPGDLLLLQKGSLVVASCRVLSVNALHALIYPPVRAEQTKPMQEAVIAGQSLSPGTEILAGEGRAVVTATGEQCLKAVPVTRQALAEYHAHASAATDGIAPYVKLCSLLTWILLLPAAVLAFLISGETFGILPIFSVLCGVAVCASPALLLLGFRLPWIGVLKKSLAEGQTGGASHCGFKNAAALKRTSALTDVFVLGHGATSDGYLHLYRCASGFGEYDPTSEYNLTELQSLCEAFMLRTRALEEQGHEDGICKIFCTELEERSAFDSDALSMRLTELEIEKQSANGLQLRVCMKNGDFRLLFSDSDALIDQCTFYEDQKKTAVFSSPSREALHGFSAEVRHEGARPIFAAKQVGTQMIFLGVVALREELQADIPSVMRGLMQNGVRVTFFLEGEQEAEARYAEALGLAEPISLAEDAHAARAYAMIEHHRVFCNASMEDISDLIVQLRKQKRRIAVVGSHADALAVMRCAELAVASDDLETARHSDAQLFPCAPTVRHRADVLMPRAKCTDGGLRAFLQAHTDCRTAEQRMHLILRFYLQALLPFLALLFLACAIGIGGGSVIPILYIGLFCVPINILWLTSFPISEKNIQKPLPLSEKRILAVLSDKRLWLPQLFCVLTSVLYAAVLYWVGVIAAASCTSFLFGVGLLLCAVSVCRISYGADPAYTVKNIAKLLTIQILPVLACVFLSLPFPALGELLGVGAWHIATALFLPFVPVLCQIFLRVVSSFFCRTAK